MPKATKPDKRWVQTTISFAGSSLKTAPPLTPAIPSKPLFRPFSEDKTPIRPMKLAGYENLDYSCADDASLTATGELADDPIEDSDMASQDMNHAEAEDLQSWQENDTRVQTRLTMTSDAQALQFSTEDPLKAEAAPRPCIAGHEEGEDSRPAEPVPFQSYFLFEFPGATSVGNRDAWDSDHVRLPCSPKGVQKAADGGPTFARWDIIRCALQSDLSSFPQLKEAMLSYNPFYADRWDLRGLKTVLNDMTTPESDPYRDLIPGIANLALRLPRLCPEPIPLLRQGMNVAITLSQMQIASLLANAFFCTFPRRNDPRATSEYGSFPSINLAPLFAPNRHRRSRSRLEKLKGILLYFKRVLANPPTGSVTFHRQYLAECELPDWEKLHRSLTKIDVRTTGTIEDAGVGMLQVDFANKVIGGGVYGYGCVQEEIRFIVTTELLVARLFTERLAPRESLIVTGAERYTHYRGYSDTFEIVGAHADATPRDALGRRQTEITAIDAFHFSPKNKLMQYKRKAIQRELTKAYVGFRRSPASCYDINVPVATGNWGCGAFNGDPELKSVIQLLACTAVNRKMAYFTFGDVDLARRLQVCQEELAGAQVTAGQLYASVMNYCDDVIKYRVNDQPPGLSVFDYLRMKLGG
ncbi:hypothetical protein HDU85_004815 [Gaertneriomyces sp. JEL0708]|nr:hypothetical protein HDU85_004815 [Gaertneriomyces sp. JEL0708]